jgi:hypothetical protein
LLLASSLSRMTRLGLEQAAFAAMHGSDLLN